ncbi:type IV-A pilus assembly ATPase PilB [Gemmatimonadota bacterium]
MAIKLGQMLLKAGAITEEQLNEALSAQKGQGGTLGSNLVKMGILTEEAILNYLGTQLNVPVIQLVPEQLSKEVVSIIPADVAHKFNVIAVEKKGNTLTVAAADPTNIFVLDSIKFVTGLNVKPAIASEAQIKEAMNNFYAPTENSAENMADILRDFGDGELEVLEEEDELEEDALAAAITDAPLVRLVDSLIIDAIRRGASDIHIEPYERAVRVRYRIDGTLIEMSPIPFRLKAAVISRIKIMSELNISERRVPQDGRIKVKTGGKAVDLRVSILPVIFGEKVVMRILDAGNLSLDLAKLGYTEKALKDFMYGVKQPYGMVLVTGPTGSGKSTTLYSAMSLLNEPDTNIMTAEDPVEYNMSGINQVHVRTEIGLTFAAALRSFLRQDPNIIMVGEIRDLETAEIAIKAALTGHLVLSTLHTNDAASTINRMLDMGVAPFLLASSLNVIQAQRLLRRLCGECKEPDVLTKEQAAMIDLPEEEGSEIMKPVGCAVCNRTGYKGRTGAYEVLPISSEIKQMILDEANSMQIKDRAVELGMLSLRNDAVEKMKAGITSFDEVLRETIE